MPSTRITSQLPMGIVRLASRVYCARPALGDVGIAGWEQKDV